MDGGSLFCAQAGTVWDVDAFLASEALTLGLVSRHDLLAHHRRVLPNVHAAKDEVPTLEDRIVAAWLWSRRLGIVTGLAASALHGAQWVSPDIPIEMNHPHNKSPAGVITRRDTLLRREIMLQQQMRVTTVARTAFDLARRGPAAKAVAHLDSLIRATDFKADDVLAVLDDHPRVRGRRRVAALLDLVDAGAQSPRESWVRLVLIQAGFPKPQTQIPICATGGYPRYFLDMGWEEFKVAVEYDGEQHRTDDDQYRGDVARSEYIDGLGWRRIRVLAGDRWENVVHRVAQAGVPRGFPVSLPR